MTSMAEKLRKRRQANKAGRPRKDGVDRYPSGKIKPAETERETMSVVIEARKNINGWTGKGADERAKNPRAGYLLGVLFLDMKINEDQLDAGEAYALAMARYYRLSGIPFPSVRAQSLFSIKGHDGETTEEQAIRADDAKERMRKMRSLLLLRCVDGPQVQRTVYNVCVLDYGHLRDMPAQQILWLRRGLDALKNSGLLPQTKKMEMAS